MTDKMEKISNGIVKCKKCGKEYEEFYSIIVGHKYNWGSGCCNECLELQAKEKENTLEEMRSHKKIRENLLKDKDD